MGFRVAGCIQKSIWLNPTPTTNLDLTLTTVVANPIGGDRDRTRSAAKTPAHCADQAEAGKRADFERRGPAHFAIMAS